MEKSIFGLWRKDGRFALGSESIDVNKTFRTAFVLAHTEFMNNTEVHPKEVMIDAFPIEQGNAFCRQFDLPDNTKYVELLYFDGNEAVPVKLFHLVNDSEFDFDRCRYHTVQINTNRSRENVVRLRVFDADKKFSRSCELQHNIGWAMEYAYLDQPRSDLSHITQILAADLQVPASGKVIRVLPSNDWSNKKTCDVGRLSPETPAILRKVRQKPERNVSFLFPDVSTDEEFEGMSVFVINRHLWAAEHWRKGGGNNQENVNHTIEQVFVRGFQKLWPVAADSMKQLYKGMDVPEDEIDAQLNIFKDCLCNADRYIDLMEAEGRTFGLKQEDQGFLLEISYICPGDHIIFFDQYGRDIRVEGFLPADDGSCTNPGIALLEVCVNGFKLPGVKCRGEEAPYIEWVRRNAAALPEDDGLQTQRPHFSKEFDKFLQHRRLFSIDHALAPLLTFQFTSKEPASGFPALNNEIFSDDIQAKMMAIALGGSVSQNRVRRQRSNTPLVKRSLILLGFPDLLSSEGNDLEEMITADRLLHARVEDIQTCGECLRDLNASELDFDKLASQVKEYRKYFDEDNPLMRYVRAEPGIRMPGTDNLFSAGELANGLLRLNKFKEDLAPLMADGVTEEIKIDKEDASEIYNKIKQALTIISCEHNKHNIEDPLLRELRSLQPLAQKNLEVGRRVLQKIHDHYPDVAGAGDRIVKNLCCSLAEWAGIPESCLAINIFSESEKNLTEEASKTTRSFDEHLQTLIHNSFDGQEKFRHFSYLAANLTMSVQHCAIQKIFDKCDKACKLVPIELRRQFAIWPRNCQSTWANILKLSLNSFGDSEGQLNFEPFDVSKAVQEALGRGQTS